MCVVHLSLFIPIFRAKDSEHEVSGVVDWEGGSTTRFIHEEGHKSER